VRPPDADGHRQTPRSASGGKEGGGVRGYETFRGIKAGPRIAPAPTVARIRGAEKRGVRPISAGIGRRTVAARAPQVTVISTLRVHAVPRPAFELARVFAAHLTGVAAYVPEGVVSRTARRWLLW
jgi:hypothetical protein